MDEGNSDVATCEVAPAARKRPAQRRSKERLEKILAAATQLIARTGSDQVKMSDVASLAGISIGSLYQYVPEKAALIRMLAERYNAESRHCIEQALSAVEDLSDLVDAFAGLVDQYYEMVTAEPVMRDIWSGMQADRQLVAHQLAESRLCGAMLAAAMRKIHPHADPRMIGETALLIWELGEATVRLAISVDPVEGRAYVDTFKRIAIRELSDPPPANSSR